MTSRGSILSEAELALIFITKERGYEKLGVRGVLEMPVTLVREDWDGVCAQLLTDGGHEKKAYPRG
jgi:hypothetical protein